MKKIACVGFHDTGASVIDDLLRECDNVAQGCASTELRILHDPDGISDLEYHLVTDPHRLGSNLAIRRFYNYCKRQARQEEKLVGNEWIVEVNKYINSLICVRYKGWLWNEVEFFPLETKVRLFLFRAINHLLPKCMRKQPWYNFLPNQETNYASIPEDEFLIKTKKFVEWICRQINPGNKEFVVLDQFASAHNPANACRYTDNLKVIVVDRDPRDLYIHDVKILNEHILANDPKNFAKQYRLMRRGILTDDPQKVLRLHFEDLIYKYEDSIKKVFEFLEIDESIHHVNKKVFFNPAISINGTQLWKRYPEYSKEIEIIETEIGDMLYDYPENSDILRKEIMCGENINLLIQAYEHMDDR